MYCNKPIPSYHYKKIKNRELPSANVNVLIGAKKVILELAKKP